MDSLTIVDAVIIVVLAVGVIVGLIQGLIRQVVELAGAVASFFIATIFAGWLAQVMQNRFDMAYSPALVIGFAVLMVGGLVGFHFLARIVRKLIRMTFLGWVDRLCGASLGFILAMVVSSLLVSAVLELPLDLKTRRTIETSLMTNFVRPVAPWVFDQVFDRGDHGIDFRSIFRRSADA